MRTLVALLVVVSGCDVMAGPTPAPSQTFVEKVQAAQVRMHQRFEAARRMQLAIGLGSLNRAHDEAGLVDAMREPDFLPEWQPYVDNIRSAARGVMAAKDTVAAARTAAQLGRQCARCHEASHARIAFAKEVPPPRDPKLTSQMFTHQWAAARMWEGLIAPDEDRWLQGARTLAESRQALVAEGGRGSLGLADDVARMRLLATRALKPGSGDDRAVLYGELIAACAHCHFVIRDAVAP